MKKLTIFESSIIGLFVGVIVSTYITFLDSNGGFIGNILGGVSLLPVLNSFNVSVNDSLIITFVFVVAVFTLYGLIAGLIMKFTGKVPTAVIVLILIIFPVSVFFEQKISSPVANAMPVAPPFVATVIHAIPKVAAPEQYFGNEVVGDLNADGKDDVAFIITRNDPDRGILYYLTASLKTEVGHTGTNLIFIGNKVEPKRIGIEDGVIFVEYLDHSIKNSTTTRDFFAKVENGELKEVKISVGGLVGRSPDSENNSSTTTAATSTKR